MRRAQTRGRTSVGWRVARRWVRLTAVLTFFVFAFVTATSTADAAALPASTITLSSLTSDFSGFVKSLMSNTVGTPKQASASAAGHGGLASADKAGKGTGHAPGV